MGGLGSIPWGALLGFVSAFVGQSIAYRTIDWIAAREGRTGQMLRHRPYLRPVQVIAVPLGALLSWTTGVVWAALLAGPAAGLCFAVPALVAHAFYRGRDHRLCEDHEPRVDSDPSQRTAVNSSVTSEASAESTRAR